MNKILLTLALIIIITILALLLLIQGFVYPFISAELLMLVAGIIVVLGLLIGIKLMSVL